jgi:serine/threonine protein kinase
MPLLQTCLSLVRKYGPVAKVVATGVLNVVAPGSGTLVEMAGKALDAASASADKIARENWERELLARLGQSEAELTRLGQLLEFLTGPLAVVCDKATAFADQADDLPDIIGRAIAADPSLGQVLHQINGLKEQFSVFQADMRRLADRQDEAAPVYVRMNRVADYFDELWQAGIKPKEFVRLLHDRTRAVACIEQGDTGELDPLFLEMRTVAPKAASIPILEAAASVREFNYPAAQRALATAIRLKPGDGELLELSQRVTTLATRSTPSQPRPLAPTGPKRLQPGDTLDGWRLEERLGAGGWGQVFRAVRDGHTRALKVMHPELAADARFVQQFKQEIATLQRLPRHANLVRIEDFGYCPQRQTWYLAMEYVDGPTLERYLTDKGPLNEAHIHKVFADAIDGLAQAHAAGIVHRDIKPGNLIFRRSDQRLVFVDFGLAVGVEDFGHTRVGGLSVQFAAPEQHYGESATQASDVFCLCAVIHYALHYDKPEQRKPNRFSPKLAPESLREPLTRGLAHNVADRLADAGQLRQAFKPAAVPVATAAPRAPTADPVTDYGKWKQQVEELKAQSLRAADLFDFARAVALLEQVPAKHRDNALLAEWTHKRDRLAELWGQVESGWREMSEDELCDQLSEIISLHPDHPRAKPWLAQVAGKERQKQHLRRKGDADIFTVAGRRRRRRVWQSGRRGRRSG